MSYVVRGVGDQLKVYIRYVLVRGVCCHYVFDEEWEIMQRGVSASVS